MRRLLALALAAWLAAPAPAAAQVTTDAAGLRDLAARLLEQGGADRARDLALALLARDPGDVSALLLLARAELERDDPAAALTAARRAHAEADGADEARARLAAARIAARAEADLGRFTRAQIWLRRAREDAPDAEAAARVAQDYRAVRDANPLAVSLTFGIAPSSNVNGGSTSETITLPGLPFVFVLDGAARALSGYRLTGGGTLGWRLARGEAGETRLEVQAQGHTYVLSPAAREQAPDSRGSDFSDLTATASLVHRWRLDGGQPAQGSLTWGRTWYAGDPYLDFAQGSLARGVALGEDDRLDLTGFAERTWRLDLDEAFWSLGGKVAWAHLRESGDRATLSLAVRDSLTDLTDVGFDSATLGLGHEWRRPVAGLRLAVSAEAEWRRYDRSAYAEGGRIDRTGRVRASVGLPRLELYGFYPSVGVEASVTESDAALYDRRALTLDLGLRSSF